MTVHTGFRRVALMVHPTRPIDAALATLTRWTRARGVALVQLANRGEMARRVVEPSHIEPGDLVVAVGGDGTVLSALRTAASADRPVLGVACREPRRAERRDQRRHRRCARSRLGRGLDAAVGSVAGDRGRRRHD